MTSLGTWGVDRRRGQSLPSHIGSRDVVADVCLIVEGCYPYVPGGVSAWIDWLMRSQPSLTFTVVSLWPGPTDQPPRYDLPDNVVGFDHLYLQNFGDPPVTRLKTPPDIDALAEALSRLTTAGGAAALAEVDHRLDLLRRKLPLATMFNSPVAWQLVLAMYRADMPFGSFLHYFWAWRALLGGLFSVLEYELPAARVYHTISTGYAGLLAARASLETGRPALLTEHGIYTNERRIELLMADWVADTIDKGHALDDPRFDLRDMWVRAFEAYARTCYEAATEIVTLYGDNQRLQKVLGAADAKLAVIANGIDVARFAAVTPPAPDARPTIALIGRVVPIKDVETYIAAARLVADRVPALRALILGPMEEDKAYAAECRRLIAELKLEEVVELTGTVSVVDYLPKIHVAVLSSLSESQPLVLLEAGAAGVPYVATNVGSCRELLLGRPDENPPLGAGGIVTDLVAPDQIADAVVGLLQDEPRRRAMGETLRRRIATLYTSTRAVEAYRELYARLIGRAAPTTAAVAPASANPAPVAAEGSR
jgi:polysaccharide biosynthesis protein PelF